MFQIPSSVVFSSALLLALMVAGCGSSAPAPATAAANGADSAAGGTAESKRVQAEYDKSGRLTRLTYDRNGDGKIDTWGFMDGPRVVRVEVDENGDGQVDKWEFHSTGATGSTGSNGSRGAAGSTGAAGAAGARGSTTPKDAVDLTLEHIEEATRHDGKVSRWEYFDQGVLSRVEEDTDGNGKIDKWETYADGGLVLMALDTTGRGTPNERLIYGPDGKLSRTETDPTGSGTFRPLSK